jgi:hypothetical protein
MARPRKLNADYFSHDSNARHDLKIKALESMMGTEGYALYFKILEFLAGSDHYEIDYNKAYIKNSLPTDLNCTPETFEKFINHATELELLITEQGKIFSLGLKKRLAVLDRIRELDRKRKGIEEPEDNKNSPSGKYMENTRNTPSTGKENKEEDKKREGSTDYKDFTIDEIKMKLMELGIARGDAADLLDQYGKSGMVEHLIFFDENIKYKNKYTPEQKLEYITNLLRRRKK